MRSAGGCAGFDRLHRSRAGLRLIRAIGPDLQGREPRSFSGKGHIGHEFSLKHLPGKQQLAIFVLVPDRVRDQGSVQRQGQPGSKIAYLVGVGKQHQFRLKARNKLLQGVNVGVRGIGFERGRFQVVYLLHLVPGQFLSQRRGLVTRQNHFDRPCQSLCQWLGRRPGSPARRGSAYLPAAPRLPGSDLPSRTQGRRGAGTPRPCR